MAVSHDDKHPEKHNVPRRAIKAIRQNLENALFSFGEGNRIGFIVPDIDGDGKPLLIGIEKGVVMDRKPVNAVRSVYGLDNPEAWIRNQIASGKKFVVYKEKEANSFLQTYGYSASVGEGIKPLDEKISQPEKKVKEVLPESLRHKSGRSGICCHECRGTEGWIQRPDSVQFQR